MSHLRAHPTIAGTSCWGAEKVVVTVGMYGEIRRLHLEGLSQRGIAQRLHISRNTVRKYCDGDAVPWERKPHERAPAVVTEEVQLFIRGCLREDELQGIRKQRHTAKRIYDRLVEERGFCGGESTIRNAVRKLRNKAAKACIPLEFPAGSAVQVDWGEATVLLDGRKTVVNLFCARLCYSCAPIVFAYRRQNEECFLDALVRVFEYYGGVPRRVIFDNGRVAVKDGFGAWAQKQEGYARLSAHYGFEAVFCNPASGHEKGLVEGLVGFIRRNVCVPLPQVRNMDELNGKLLAKCLQYGGHRIAGRAARVGEMLEEERGVLLPLPGYRFESFRKIHTRVSRYCTVRFDTNNYSVPAEHCAREVTVRASPETVEILLAGSVIASHPRCYGRQQNVCRMEHYLKLLERKGRAIPFARPVTQAVPEAFLGWLYHQERTPKQITELLLRCREEGCEAVMSGHSPPPPPAPIPDRVPIHPVDLGQYDALCGRKAARI